MASLKLFGLTLPTAIAPTRPLSTESRYPSNPSQCATAIWSIVVSVDSSGDGFTRASNCRGTGLIYTPARSSFPGSRPLGGLLPRPRGTLASMCLLPGLVEPGPGPSRGDRKRSSDAKTHRYLPRMRLLKGHIVTPPKHPGLDAGELPLLPPSSYCPLCPCRRVAARSCSRASRSGGLTR